MAATPAAELRQQQIGRLAESLGKLDALRASLSRDLAGHIMGAARRVAPSLSLDEMEKIVDRAVAALRPEPLAFEKIFEGKYFELGERRGVYGKREMHAVLKGGAENLQAACDEINARIEEAPNYPAGGFKVYLSADYDLPDGRDDIVVIYTPVIANSGDCCGADPKTSHAALLKHLGLEQVNNALHRLACGAFRAAIGFPESLDKIGTPEDPGDLCEGMVVRTRKGVRSGAVASHRDGIRGREDYRQGAFVVAGAAPRNL